MKRFRWLKLVLVLPLALLRLLADLAGWLAFALDRKPQYFITQSLVEGPIFAN